MEVVVTYDVSTETEAGRRRLRRVAKACEAQLCSVHVTQLRRRRLRRVAKACEGYGQRVQKSVFECSLTEVQLEGLLQRLLTEINVAEDSLRVYRLVEPRERYVRVFGVDRRIDLVKGTLVV